MQQHVNTNTTNTTLIKNNGLHQLSSWLVNKGHDLWLQRNNQIYNKKSSSSAMERMLNKKIHQLYRLQEEISFQDRDIFYQPIENRLQMNEKQKMTWIEQTVKTMKVSMEEHQKRWKLDNRTLDSFSGNRKQRQNSKVWVLYS